MKYYQIAKDGEVHLCLKTSDGALFDLSELEPSIKSFLDLLILADDAHSSIDELASKVIVGKHIERNIMEISHVLKPINPPEVWAAGVTYKRSEQERRLESDTPDVYSKVYASDRPELFFKGTARTVVGHGDEIGIRQDSSWNVPEPELAFVVSKGAIVGYTIGNDVSSRSIEGENPLYLPQAKFYDNSCAIGPCILSAEVISDPHNLGITMSVTRDEVTVFKGSTSTSQLVRSCEEISGWLHLHNHVPDGTVVLTGTGIVPPPEFSLLVGDICKITIDQIGVLQVGTKEV